MREGANEAAADCAPSTGRLGPWFLIAVVLLVAGCASPAPAPPVPSVAQQQVDTTEALLVERYWLQSWFKATPVRIVQRASGAIDITVPREFCFETGRSEIEPALAAVLDKLAQSLGRVPLAQVPLIAAPSDDPATSHNAGAALALERARAVREHLRAAGVDTSRLGTPSGAAGPAMHLYVTGPPRARTP